jgi:predicted metalloprotease
MRKRSAVTTAALSLFGLLILGCAIPEPEPFPGGDDPEITTETTEATPTTTETRTSMEGAYDYNTMDEYVDAVVGSFMTRWLNETWPRMSVPYVQYVASNESGPEACTDYDGNPGEYSGYSYEYCPADLTVYVGQDTLWEFYSETGDAGPAMGMAHEFGHHVQYELGETPPSTAAESIDFENQADCIAGAWAQWMEEIEALDTEENSPNGRSDLEDIELMFPIIASAEGEDRDHGTLEEREQAFTDGYTGGESACGLD